MEALTLDHIATELARKSWQGTFGESSLLAGQRAVAAKLVTEVSLELIDTGDAEISGVVAEKDGTIFEPSLALWKEAGQIRLESSCICGEGVSCRHAAALLFYLSKNPEARLARASGGVPHAERIIRRGGGGPGWGEQAPLPDAGTTASTGEPTFLLRVSRCPERTNSFWLPAVSATAMAVYGNHRTPLVPGGTPAFLVTPQEKIRRSSVAETAALQTLYALDLQPGAEEAPASLRKIAPPETPEGTLWVPDQQAWPHPEFYWQRFWLEGTPALQKRGWEVRFAPDFPHRPLVFKTETWRAEIVEEGKGWFHLSAGFSIDGEEFELQPILAALVKNRFLESTSTMPDGQEFLVYLPDGRGLALPIGRFRRLLETLGELVQFSFGNGPLRVRAFDAALLAGSPMIFPELRAPVEITRLAEYLADFQGIERGPLPSGLQANLRDYQADGFHWMQFLARHHLHGILADDMGLGKTLQTLTHLLAEVESGRSGGRPSLVIAPTSVVRNWEREATKFVPCLKILVLQGADRHRNFHRIPRVDVVLTSFALLHRDLAELRRYDFHLLILDEAQHIKNPEAQTSQAARSIAAQHRLCLSGTPVENHLGELWSQFHFLFPGLLGTLEQFRVTYQTPIEKDGDEARRAALARRIGPLILRRTKQEVAKELPPKTEISHPISMDEAQADLYETVRATMDKQVRQALAIRGQEAQVVFLDALLKLRQICCHPALLHERHADVGSAKFSYLIDLLATLKDEGHRVLLFSQFTSMLSLIEAHLQSTGTEYLILTGATKDRQGLVERFQGGEGDVFLISLKAGGTGLTLTGADTVIHYDPWWNPAAENQATDRAYRIGQDKPVFVHKLICEQTVEERIQQMQERKDGIATDLLSGAIARLDLTPELLAGLLG
jgi:superfamily II DNA or RNA helicase